MHPTNAIATSNQDCPASTLSPVSAVSAGKRHRRRLSTMTFGLMAASAAMVVAGSTAVSAESESGPTQNPDQTTVTLAGTKPAAESTQEQPIAVPNSDTELDLDPGVDVDVDDQLPNSPLFDPSDPIWDDGCPGCGMG